MVLPIQWLIPYKNNPDISCDNPYEHKEYAKHLKVDIIYSETSL